MGACTAPSTPSFDEKSLYQMILQSDFTQLTTVDQLSECESTNHESQATPSVASVSELMEDHSPKRRFSQMFEDDFFSQPEPRKQLKLDLCCHHDNSQTQGTTNDYQCIDNLFNLDDDQATSLTGASPQIVGKPLPMV